MRKLLSVLLVLQSLVSFSQNWTEDSIATTGNFYKLNSYNLRGFNNSGIITSSNGTITRGGWGFSDSSKMYYRGGKIGIGIVSPVNDLHVYSTTSAGGISVDGNNNPSFSIFNSGARKGYWAVPNANGGFFLDALAGDMVLRNETLNRRLMFGIGARSTLSMDSISIRVGNQTITSTTNPYFLSMGATYSPAAGQNMKFIIYDDGVTANRYGFGTSSNQLDYITPLAQKHAFYNGTDLRMTIDSFGIRFPSNNITYLNFGTTIGSTGYGLRNNFGVIEFKQLGGSWAALGSGGGGGGGDVYLANVNNFTNINTFQSSNVTPFTVSGTGAYMRATINNTTSSPNVGMFYSFNGVPKWQTAAYGAVFVINSQVTGNNVLDVDTLTEVVNISKPKIKAAKVLTGLDLVYKQYLDSVLYPLKQTFTSGSTVTLPTGLSSEVWLIVNPASTLASLTATMPATPVDGQRVRIVFGGTITSGAVVTSFTTAANSGQSIRQAVTGIAANSGDSISYGYNSTNTTWYRL